MNLYDPRSQDAIMQANDLYYLSGFADAVNVMSPYRENNISLSSYSSEGSAMIETRVSFQDPAISEIERLDHWLKNNISKIELVKYIYRISELDTLRIFSVIDTDSMEARDSIYEKELELMDVFQSLPFDFRVVAEEHSPIISFINSDATRVYSR